jgi:hypothetical protein
MDFMELTTCIWSIVLGNYLDFKSVVQLDSSMLQRKSRAALHQHFAECVTASQLKLGVEQVDAALQWTTVRCIRFRQVGFSTRHSTESAVGNFLLMTASHMDNLTFCGGTARFNTLDLTSQRCVSLKSLSLLNFSSMVGLAKLLRANSNSLQSLNLQNCSLPTGLSQGCTLPNLTQLRLVLVSGFNRTGVCLALHVAMNCPRLTSLTLATAALCASDLIGIVSRTPELRDLSVTTIDLSGTDLQVIADLCPKLTTFAVSSCHFNGPQDKGVRVPLIRGLTSLRVEHEMKVHEPSLLKLATVCTSLTTLSFVGSNNTPVEGLRALVVHNPTLRHLELNVFSATLGDKFLELLTANCGESLEHLSLRPCTGLRDSGLASIARSCPHLRHLDLTPPDYASEISATALLHVARRCPELRRLYLSRRHCHACRVATTGNLTARFAPFGPHTRYASVCGAAEGSVEDQPKFSGAEPHRSL